MSLSFFSALWLVLGLARIRHKDQQLSLMLTPAPPLCLLYVVHLQAALHGVKFNNQTLRLAWHKPVTALTTADADEAEPEEDEVCGCFSPCISVGTVDSVWGIF